MITRIVIEILGEEEERTEHVLGLVNDALRRAMPDRRITVTLQPSYRHPLRVGRAREYSPKTAFEEYVAQAIDYSAPAPRSLSERYEVDASFREQVAQAIEDIKAQMKSAPQVNHKAINWAIMLYRKLEN